MSNFSQKYKEFESKKKKKNRTGNVLLILGLVVFAGLFIFNIYTQKEKQKDTEIIFEYNNNQIIEKEKQDAIEYNSKRKEKDSLKQVLQQVQTTINEIKKETGINNSVRKKINSLQVKVNTIQAIAQDTIIVRYYKRMADSNRVERAIKGIQTPNFYIHYRNVPNDDSIRKANTLYYGKNVKKDYVQLLYKKLIENKVGIKGLQPFVSGRGFEWKQNAIEIGFEKPTSTTNENGTFYIRIYSYQPDERMKYAIRNKLEAKGFQVKLYPDWPKKPSFFSNESTVLYYDKSNRSRAISIAKTLTDLTKYNSFKKGIVTKFTVKIGVGYGVALQERKKLFIVHYNGSR